MADNMQQYYDALRRADAVGDVESARRLTQFIQQQLQTTAQNTQPQSPSKVAASRGSAVAGALKDVSKRIGRLGESVSRQVAGEQSFPSTAAQFAGETIGGVGDVGAGLITGAFRMLPDVVEDPIRQGAGNVMQMLGRLPDAGGGTIGENLPQVIGNLAQQFSEFEEENPVLGANIRAAGNIFSVLPSIRGAKMAAKGAKRSGRQFGKNIIPTKKQIDKMIPPPKKITADRLAQESRKAYKLSKQLGGTIPAQQFDDALQGVFKILDDFKPNVSIPKKAGKAILKAKDPSNMSRQIEDILEPLRGSDLTLGTYEDIDKALSSLANSAVDNSGKISEAGNMVKDVQRNLRNFIENIDPKKAASSPEGIEAYKKARAIWHKKMIVNDIEDIISKSQSLNQPARYIKRNLTKMLNDPKTGKYLNNVEKKALKKATDSGKIREIVSALGGLVTSQLPSSLGAGSGEFALSATQRAASVPARDLAEQIARRKASQAMQTIGQQVLPENAINIPEEMILGRGGLEALRRMQTGAGIAGRPLQNPRFRQTSILGLLRDQQQGEQ